MRGPRLRKAAAPGGPRAGLEAPPPTLTRLIRRLLGARTNFAPSGGPLEAMGRSPGVAGLGVEAAEVEALFPDLRMTFCPLLKRASRRPPRAVGEM